MTEKRTALAICAASLITLALLVRYHTHAQTQRPPSVQQFYETLVAHYDPSSVPTLSSLEQVTHQLSGASPEEINKALPAIFAALAYPEKIVKDYAITALYMIALRPDSAVLLKNRVDTIGNVLLTARIPETRAGALVVLSTLRPSPPPEVVPIFLSFIKQTTPDVQAQGGGVIFALVQVAPENPEVLAAIREFLSRPLDNQTKREALVAVAKPQMKDPQIVSMIIAATDNDDQHIKITATQALGQLGQKALQQAEPALQRLANDPNPDVQDAAKQALRKLRPNT